MTWADLDVLKISGSIVLYQDTKVSGLLASGLINEF